MYIKRTILLIGVMLSTSITVAQNLTIQQNQNLSQYLSDWGDFGQLQLSTNFGDTTLGSWVTFIYDTEGTEILLTDTSRGYWDWDTLNPLTPVYYIVDSFPIDTVFPNEILRLEEFAYPEYCFFDSTIAEYYLANGGRFPSGVYTLKVKLYAPDFISIIDSTISTITITSGKAPVNSFPNDFGEIDINKYDSIPFFAYTQSYHLI